MTTCFWCGKEIDDPNEEIACWRTNGENTILCSEACLDEHIKKAHPDRPLTDRPDLRPLGRKNPKERR